MRSIVSAAFALLTAATSTLSFAQSQPAIPRQPESKPAAPAGSAAAIPGFWDPKRRPERPADLSRITLIRFMTEIDYPPFNYAGPDGQPAGLNVELARMICEELKVQCTMQMRRFDTLFSALAENRGDAAIASIAVNSETRKLADFTDPYYRTPARFVARHNSPVTDVRPEQLAGREVAVVAGSAHEAFIKSLFTEVRPRPYATAEQAREALRRGEVDLLFGDGISLSFWLNGADSQNCCAFAGGPYIESYFFNEGVGIAVRRGNDTLRQVLNWALFRLWERSRFGDLWLRYFPVNPF